MTRRTPGFFVALTAALCLLAALPASAEEPATGLYIVLFEEAPLATYEGEIVGLAATSPRTTGAAKLDTRSPESRAYLDFLAQAQQEHLDNMTAALGRTVEPTFSYRVAGNGVAVPMDAAEAAVVANLPGVAIVRPDELHQIDTDAGPTWIGAPAIWNGTATGAEPANQGEGIVIGVVDTGINMTHPSFSDTPSDGYTYVNPLGAGNYLGWCDPTNPNYDPSYPCNDKLIGGWDFVEGLPGITEADGPEDDNGHGSHTAGTSGGNTLDVPPISGVAPHAFIISYDACYTNAAGQGLCPGAATSAAIDQAAMDMVDVINYSISGGTQPWLGDSDTFFLNALNAGVFPAASAGNSGPGAGTTAHLGPWVATVANATHDRVTHGNTLENMSGGGSPPADLDGSSMTGAYGPAPIVYAGDYSNGDPNPEQCLNPFPPGTWTGGEIVVCDRGSLARVLKGQHVADGGAGGFILANISGGTAGTNPDPHIIPAVHVDIAEGDLLRAWLAGGSGHMATITASSIVLDPAIADRLNAGSSRGPSGLDIIKPDIAGPGTQVLAAVNAGSVAGFTGPQVSFFTGTSMSSPHVAGAAALVRKVHPSWSPSQVRSALMLTADTNMRKEDDVTPADPHDMGSGRVDLEKAAIVGFVLDETFANYQAANPATGGDPATLNIASMASRDCSACSWTRTIEGTAPGTINWTVTTSGPADLRVNVSPSSFSLANGATQVLDIEALVDVGLPLGSFVFAEVIFTPDDPSVPVSKMPIAVIPTGIGTEVFTDGFESGNTSSWSSVVN